MGVLEQALLEVQDIAQDYEAGRTPYKDARRYINAQMAVVRKAEAELKAIIATVTDEKARLEKVRENRIRRMATKKGLALHKGRGRYWNWYKKPYYLCNPYTNILVYGNPPMNGLNLDEAEDILVSLQS